MDQSQVLISTFEYAYRQSLGVEGARKVIERAVQRAGLSCKEVLSREEALQIHEQLKNEEGLITSVAMCLTTLFTPEVQALIGKIKELEENITERIRAEEALRLIQGELEKHVEERTINLLKTNQQLALEINEREKIEEALRRSEERFRLAAKNASDFIYDWDITTGVLTWFGNVDKNLGYEPGEFPRTISAWENSLHPEDSERVRNALERHFQAREPYEVDYRLRKKNGDFVYWSDRGSVIRDEHGKAVRMYGACTDVSARKKAEIALQESRQLLSNMINFLPDPTFVIDTKGVVISWNKAMEELTGVKAGDMVGKGDYEYAYIFFRKREPLLIDLVVKPDPEAEKKYSSLTRENTMLIAEIFTPYLKEKGLFLWGKASPLYDKNNVVVGSIETMRDITLNRQRQMELDSAYKQLTRTQAQLVQSAKMASIGLLAGGVAHEINNPLTGVLNNVQLIKMMAEKKECLVYSDIREILSAVEESSWRCAKIVKSLLEFSQESKGNQERVSLNAIVDEVTGLIEKELLLQNIAIDKETRRDIPLLTGDPQLFQQIIIDVIANAQWAISEKSGTAGGVIAIKTGYNADTGRVFFTIGDSGIGIAADDIDRIFEPFFTTKEVGRGTGLGLSIVYNIVSKYDGDIAVTSDPEKGTVFTISFPVTREISS